MNRIEEIISESVSRSTYNVPVRTNLTHKEYSETLLKIRNDYKIIYADKFSKVSNGMISNDEFMINQFDTLLVEPGSAMPMNIPLAKNKVKPLKGSHRKAIQLIKKLYRRFIDSTVDRPVPIMINRKSASGWVALSKKAADKLPVPLKPYLREVEIGGFPYVLTDFYGIPLKVLYLKFISQFQEFIDFRIVITMGYRLDKADKVKNEDGKLTSKTRNFTVLDENYKFKEVYLDPYNYKTKRIIMRRRTINKLNIWAHVNTSSLSGNVLQFFKEMEPWKHNEIPDQLSSNSENVHIDVNQFDNSEDGFLREDFCETFGIPLEYMEQYLKNPYICSSFIDNNPMSVDESIRAKEITIGDLKGLSQSGVTLFTAGANYWKFGVQIIATMYDLKFTTYDIVEWLYGGYTSIKIKKKNIGDDNLASANEKGMMEDYIGQLKETSIYELDFEGHTMGGFARSTNGMVAQDMSGIFCNSLENPKRWNSLIKPYAGWGWKIKQQMHPNMKRMITGLYDYFGPDFQNWVESATPPENVELKGVDFYNLNDLYWKEDIPDNLKNIVYFSEITTDDIAQLREVFK